MNLVTLSNRHKSYVDAHRTDCSHEVGDQVFNRIRPNKSTIWFGKGTKFSPWFIVTFRIREKIRPVSYRLILPPHFHKSHDVFHVSILRHYVSDEYHKLDWRELHVSDVGTVIVKPLRILDLRVRQLRHRMLDLLPKRMQRLYVMATPHFLSICDANFNLYTYLC